MTGLSSSAAIESSGRTICTISTLRTGAYGSDHECHDHMNQLQKETWGVGGHLNWQIIFIDDFTRTRLVSGTSAVGISA